MYQSVDLGGNLWNRLGWEIVSTFLTFRTLECSRFRRFTSPTASLKGKHTAIVCCFCSDCVTVCCLVQVSTLGEHKLNYKKAITCIQCPLDQGEIRSLT